MAQGALSKPVVQWWLSLNSSKVTISGCRWGTWWETSKGTRETMTGAHLGSRRAHRRHRTAAIAAPRVVYRRCGHGGAHPIHGPNAKFLARTERRNT